MRDAAQKTPAPPLSEAASPGALQQFPHPVAFWSGEGRLVGGNASFAERFDPSQVPLDGSLSKASFLELVRKLGLMLPAKRAVPSDGRDGLESQTQIFIDGSYARVVSWPIPGGECTAFLDVTEDERNARQLERARDAATQADQSKSRFLRAANHDLRQPLASLKILIYSCIAAETAEQRHEALHAMDVSVAIMEDLLGALLNIGQLDAGRIEAKIQTFQLSQIFERLRVQYAHLAGEKGIDLRIVGTNAAVASDRVLLERILSNFVGNAIRYTDIGRVLVGCRRLGPMLRIEVHDTGCGIDEKHHAAIFDEFYRVSEHQEYRRHSLGLGLNIARRLAEMLEHKVAVRSAPGEGSVFSIDVPLGDIWHSNIGEPEISERIGGEFSGLHCLLIEDDPHLRTAMSTLLKRWGAVVQDVENFDDIQAALDELEKDPELIITDYRLRGDLTGPDVVDTINELIDRPCLAIVLTADTNPQLIEKIRSEGYPVLIKPVSPPALRVIMHNILYEPELVPEIS